MAHEWLCRRFPDPKGEIHNNKDKINTTGRKKYISISQTAVSVTTGASGVISACQVVGLQLNLVEEDDDEEEEAEAEADPHSESKGEWLVEGRSGWSCGNSPHLRCKIPGRAERAGETGVRRKCAAARGGCEGAE